LVERLKYSATLRTKVDRGSSVIQIDIGRKHAGFYLDSNGVEIVGRRKNPASFSRIEETQISEMIVRIRDKYVKVVEALPSVPNSAKQRRF
jgi:hypothetical protein